MTDRVWNSKFECMTRTNLETLKSDQLEGLVRRTKHIDLYRGYEALTVSGSRNVTETLRNLPLISKDQLLQHSNQGLLFGQKNRVVRVHASSGTSGASLLVGYTRKDLVRWREILCRSFSATGLGRGEKIQLAVGYGLHTGGLGLQSAAEYFGLTVVPSGTCLPRRQISLLYATEASAIVSTPSFALYLARVAARDNLQFPPAALRIGLFGAEPWTEEMRMRIDTLLGITSFDLYGFTEAYGPGVAYECNARKGLHVCEDHFIPEIIDPTSGGPVADGEVGELVVTTLSKEAMPLIRYRTGDITRLIPGTCLCGRSSVRIDRIMGRTDDMLIVRGVKIFPGAVESIINSLDECSGEYRITESERHSKTRITVTVEVARVESCDDVGLKRNMQYLIREIIGLSVDVRLVPIGALSRGVTKVKRFGNVRPELP